MAQEERRGFGYRYRLMKCRPFFTRYKDTWILGPAASISVQQFRIGLGLILFEVGLCFTSEKPFGYGCSGCGAIDAGTPDQLPPEWERVEKLDSTVHFLCPFCKKLSAPKLKALSRLPKKVEDFWYCHEIFDYCYKLHQAGKPWKCNEIELPCETFLINPYADEGGKIPEVSDIIPCIKIGNLVGYYLVTKKWRYASAGSDFAGWDDGYYVNLEFEHYERAKRKRRDPDHA